MKNYVVENKEKARLTSMFIDANQAIVKSMKHCEHSAKEYRYNPYHVEGDVWTHTMMVVSHSKTLLGVISALCHDAAKPMARQIFFDDKTELFKARFSGHESMAFWMIDDMVSCFNLDEDQRRGVKIAVALHGSFWASSQDAFEEKVSGFSLDQINLISELLHADSCGRISFSEPGFLPSSVKIDELQGKVDSNKELILMVGPPGSGKSTITKSLFPEADVLSRDDIVEEFGIGQDYSEKWRSTVDDKELNLKVRDEFKERSLYLMRNSERVVVDMTNMTRKSRRQFKIWKSKGFSIKAVVLDVSLKDCHLRNSQREGKVIQESVINDFSKKFSFPLFDEVDEIEFIRS